MMNEEKKQEERIITHRVITMLDRKELEFLDKLGKDALFSTGSKLSRAKIIAWMVDFIERLRLNGEGLKSENDFENRIRKSIPPATEG